MKGCSPPHCSKMTTVFRLYLFLKDFFLLLPCFTSSPSLQDQSTSIIHSSLTAPLYDYPSSNTTRYTVPNHHASAPTSPESGSVN